MEITKMLTLSTAHISKETAMLLVESNDKIEFSLSTYQKNWRNFNYGWFIHVPEELKEYPEAYFDVPNDLMKCLLFAKDLECELLCLDEDGEILDYLEKFDW